MNFPTLCRNLLTGILLLLLLASCKGKQKTYDDCMLQASRDSQNDRQFKKLSEACKAQYPNR